AGSLQLLVHLVEREVDGLSRVFGFVEQGIEVARDDLAHTIENAHATKDATPSRADTKLFGYSAGNAEFSRGNSMRSRQAAGALVRPLSRPSAEAPERSTDCAPCQRFAMWIACPSAAALASISASPSVGCG